MQYTSVYHKIKTFIKQGSVNGVLISRTDIFLGEYYPPYAERLKTVSGFSGSAGLALITANKDVLFVDSRYTIQAKNQSDFIVYEIPTETTPSVWLNENMAGKTIAFNPQTHSLNWVKQMRERLQEKNISLFPLSLSTVTDFFGTDEFNQTDIFDYDISYCGETSESKLARLAQHIRQQNWDAYIITLPENVSWLLNKRAKTVTEYPVVFQKAFVEVNGQLTYLNNQTITRLKGKRIAFDPATMSFDLAEILQQIATVEMSPDIVNFWKACKNQTEIQNIKQACLYESTVICRFLAWVETHKSTADEMMCDKKLIAFRQENPLYIGDSFETIAAVGGHGALAHYRANEESNISLTSAPLLLVDTGGHYLNGSTDMTRTIAVDTPTPLMKKRYTQVLQGHIDLALSSIKNNDKAGILDKKAHAYLRADNVDYYHSTGHGIGLMLAVHEMPPIIHEKDTLGIKAGMIFSNEPAFYSEEESFGIRLENMLLSVQKNEQELAFENLLFIPFDYRLINFDQLTQEQMLWLKNYHQRIYNDIFPMLSKDEQSVLTPFIKAFGVNI